MILTIRLKSLKFLETKAPLGKIRVLPYKGIPPLGVPPSRPGIRDLSKNVGRNKRFKGFPFVSPACGISDLRIPGFRYAQNSAFEHPNNKESIFFACGALMINRFKSWYIGYNVVSLNNA